MVPVFHAVPHVLHGGARAVPTWRPGLFGAERRLYTCAVLAF